MVQVWAQTGLRGECSGRSKSRELHSLTGLLSATPSRLGPWKRETRKPINAAIFRSAAAVSHRLSSSQALHIAAATVQQQWHIKALPFVTATDGASVRACV